MNKNFDIDLDFADRSQALNLIQYTSAMQQPEGKPVRHNTGVYVNPVPVDSLTGLCSLDYKLAEELGYIKLDFLNNSVYTLVQSPAHLDQLLATEPPWHRLTDHSFVQQVVHINAHWDLLHRMPEPVDSLARLAMFLAVIRPAKRHLAGKRWAEVAKTVWDKSTDGQYGFKKAHACSYSYLVAIHMVLLNQ